MIGMCPMGLSGRMAEADELEDANGALA